MPVVTASKILPDQKLHILSLAREEHLSRVVNGISGENQMIQSDTSAPLSPLARRAGDGNAGFISWR